MGRYAGGVVQNTKCDSFRVLRYAGMATVLALYECPPFPICNAFCVHAQETVSAAAVISRLNELRTKLLGTIEANDDAPELEKVSSCACVLACTHARVCVTVCVCGMSAYQA